MTGGDATGAEVLHDARVRERVEVTAHHHGYSRHARNGGLKSNSPLALCPHHDRVKFISEHQGLNQLNVSILGVPVYVCVGHKDMLAVHARTVLDFKESGYANVVFEHDTIEHRI